MNKETVKINLQIRRDKEETDGRKIKMRRRGERRMDNEKREE